MHARRNSRLQSLSAEKCVALPVALGGAQLSRANRKAHNPHEAAVGLHSVNVVGTHWPRGEGTTALAQHSSPAMACNVHDRHPTHSNLQRCLKSSVLQWFSLSSTFVYGHCACQLCAHTSLDIVGSSIRSSVGEKQRANTTVRSQPHNPLPVVNRDVSGCQQPPHIGDRSWCALCSASCGYSTLAIASAHCLCNTVNQRACNRSTFLELIQASCACELQTEPR